MDIQKITHKSYRKSVVIALVLSCMTVAFISILGRGIMNLKGALTAEKPAVDSIQYALAKANLTADTGIKDPLHLDEVYELPVRNQLHSFYVREDDDIYFVQLKGPDAGLNEWELAGKPDKLHGFKMPKKPVAKGAATPSAPLDASLLTVSAQAAKTR